MEKVTGRVTIRQNYDRIDYQYKISNSIVALTGLNNLWVRTDPVSIQNKRLRLVSMRALSFFYDAGTAGNFQGLNTSLYVAQSFTGVAIDMFGASPVIPKTQIVPTVQSQGPAINVATITEEPEIAFWSSYFGGNTDYNHLFTNSFAMGIQVHNVPGTNIVTNVLVTRVWLTFIQERANM